MKLNEFENNKSTIAAKALTEHYELPFNVAKLNMSATKTMLGKVRNVLRETKQSADFYNKSTSIRMILQYTRAIDNAGASDLRPH